MPMFRVLPKVWRVFLVSADTISLEARRRISRMVDSAPSMTPAEEDVITVTVVVTVDIISLPLITNLYQASILGLGMGLL